MNDGFYGITNNIYFNKIHTVVDSNFNGFSIYKKKKKLIFRFDYI